MSCIFCEISNHEKDAEIVCEDQDLIVFKDINPSAKVHLLIVPKKHIESVNHLCDEDRDLICKIIFMAKKVASDFNLSGYRLSFNVGRDGGQMVDHLHLHLTSGFEKKHGK